MPTPEDLEAELIRWEAELNEAFRRLKEAGNADEWTPSELWRGLRIPAVKDGE